MKNHFIFLITYYAIRMNIHEVHQTYVNLQKWSILESTIRIPPTLDEMKLIYIHIY